MRSSVTAAGLGIAAGGLGLRALVALGRVLTLADLPPHADPGTAAAVYDTLTEALCGAAWGAVAAGLALALTAWLTSRVRRAPPADEGPRQAPAVAATPDPP
ncbi:hypothetical protein [Streptomyces sp. BPTC-684]|uniref:hypothetical protein n=1 Tax=Streptomyces sp. BPTC-684 TaxID=3043734 RepID=UPI0024B14031|nr:hypothetical protein [Streptomyces sp. BPTC-684]WHM37843.1 hypothetical protein QIY60_13625 [Streptomyces sp. BPTC-684]